MTAPALTGKRCQCSACGERFNSVSVFDRHRVGYFDSAEHRGARRCLHHREMLARGWLLNAAGFWIERRREAATVRVEAPRGGWRASRVQGEAA